VRFDRDRIRALIRFLWQRFNDDKCFETAGALSYTTLVSLVPLTVAVFAMVSAFQVFAGARDRLLDFVFRNFVPAAGAQVQDALTGFATNASQLTGISILVMLFSAVSMMVSIEDRLNSIWRVYRPRGWGSRLLLYWAALTLGPILAVGGLAAASYVTAMPLLRDAGVSPTLSQQLLRVLPFAVTFITLWLMYALVPNCRVPRREATIGALLGAALFEVARWGFALFVRGAHNYQQIYGALAAIPIFLLWIYLSWVIVILAASVAASLSAYEYHAPAQVLPEGAEFLGLLVVLGQFVEAQRRGACLDQATVRTREPYLRGTLIAACFDDLQRAGLIQRGEGGWMLVRSLDSTDLLHVYRHCHYRLPLRPAQLVRELGIVLPASLLALLEGTAEALAAHLGTRLDRAFPPAHAEPSTVSDA
jgi:membrane protein